MLVPNYTRLTHYVTICTNVKAHFAVMEEVKAVIETGFTAVQPLDCIGPRSHGFHSETDDVIKKNLNFQIVATLGLWCV